MPHSSGVLSQTRSAVVLKQILLVDVNIGVWCLQQEGAMKRVCMLARYKICINMQNHSIVVLHLSIPIYTHLHPYTLNLHHATLNLHLICTTIYTTIYTQSKPIYTHLHSIYTIYTIYTQYTPIYTQSTPNLHPHLHPSTPIYTQSSPNLHPFSLNLHPIYTHSHSIHCEY